MPFVFFCSRSFKSTTANGSMLTKITNGIGTSTIYHTEFFDKEKKISALKNEMTKECILKQVDDQVNILYYNNKYDQNMELTEDEMVEIIGENLRNFCKDKIIILNNFDKKHFSRSKRSTDKKRYQGQTQTQFVSFGSKNSNQETKNGLAEALSQPDLSRATVSGLNGMGQAQSQSSFGECNECSGQDYKTHSTHVVNSHPGYYPSLQPLSSISQNQNLRPYGELNTNRQSPGLQGEESQKGYSINHQYPDTYSGSGTNNKLPSSQVHGYSISPSVDAQYSGPGTNYKVPGEQNQGYIINDQYPRSETNNKLPDNQNYGYGITPSVDNQYTISGTNNQLPRHQDPRYGIESSLYGQYPSKILGSKSNNDTELGKINPGYAYNSAKEQIPNLTNINTPENKIAENNDTVNANSHSINSIPFNPSSWSYPNKINSDTPDTNQQIYPDGLGFPNIPSESGQGILTPHNTLNFDSTHPSYNWQVPVTTSIGHQNKPANYPSSVIPNYQHPMTNVLGQLTPNNPISSDMISQNKQRIINEAGGTTQNGYPLSANIPRGQDYTQLNLPSLCNFLYQTCLNALSNNKRLNEFQIASSQNTVRNPNVGKQIGNTQVPITQYPGLPFYGEGINQNQKQPNSGQPQYVIGLVGSNIQHPSDTQTGGNIKGFQSSYGQPQGILGSSDFGVQQLGYGLSGGNVNQMHPNYGQPQSASGFGVQLPKYGSSGGNVNQIHPNYGQPQSALGTSGSGIQQPGYGPSGGNVNQIHPNYDQPQSTLGSSGSGVQQPGYGPSGRNVNQIHPNYGQPQSTLGSDGFGVQQPGYGLSGKNVNQMQPNYGQPQSTLGSSGSVVQHLGYGPSGGNIDQMHPNYGQPQSTSGSSGPGVKQPGYGPSGGNVNQIHLNYGQPQSTSGSSGPGVKQPGYGPSGGNVNQIHPNYGQPQSTLGSSGSGLQQPGYGPSGENVNQIHPNYGQPQSTSGSSGSGVQQPRYGLPGGNVNQIHPNYGQPQSALGTSGSGIQQPGYGPSGGNVNQIHPNYGQPQSTLGSSGSGIQQPGYGPSGGNVNQIYSNYDQPQSTLGSSGSGIQQPGYGPSGGNVNQIHPNYGQPQSALGTSGSGIQQPGYGPSGGNVNQIHPNYGQPQSTLGSSGSGIQQPGYGPSGGNVNQIHPNYGQPQSTSGSSGPGVQQPAYGPPGGDVNQIYPESYGDNSFRGPSFKPGSEIGNINPSTNPITGGQFGTDISSGDSVTLIDTEGGDAQSMTNVDVDGQETRASASAQGKSKTGMSQTQVSGSYLGTGMFSAQAQTSDSDKGAQSQIVSNTNGTTSTAQGKGGRGQAQSQVLYNADNGIALGEAQSSGINYGTNTQLQASIKGGMADAQSTGLGSTSSQAQIGFLPHESNNSTNQKSLFKGGGTTSAQGGSYSGQSQSQLFGSYKHGISYNGAAQASTGKKLQNLPKFNLADAKLKIGQLEGSNNEVKNQTNALKNLQIIPNTLNQIDNSSVDNHKQQNISSTQTPLILSQEPSRNFDVYSEYEDNDEYDDDSDEIVNTKSVQTKKETIPKQEQNIILNLDNKHDAQITRDSDSQLKSGQVLDAGQVIPGTNGTKIPSGFRGRVASVAGDHTEAQATPGGQAQTQTVFLTPGVGSLTVVDKTKLRAQLNKESYVKPTNSFQTEINGGISKFKANENNVQYFTKSSTCGYFSFSCNYVNGATNGAKICKPNPPPFPCLRSN
ncbi:uncharacterized protein LOC113548103 isoform X2 [Rhopalosiphum maidis]|uniref:uncharacterized protein LOC113548103 isoform X2 n=1 Tax=Rhopalosiphum maidis TaxID=43146 RepID=UPI000F008A35|nr:uncharacterized protein LOC113548103 isoform X2 [Rhopalosiphum maidis]